MLYHVLNPANLAIQLHIPLKLYPCHLIHTATTALIVVAAKPQRATTRILWAGDICELGPRGRDDVGSRATRVMATQRLCRGPNRDDTAMGAWRPRRRQ